MAAPLIPGVPHELAASDFINQAPKGVHIGVVAITSRPQVVSALSTDTADLLRRISGLQAGGTTAIADSLITASDMLDKGAAPSSTLVLLTDGADNSSIHQMVEVPAVLSRAHVTLYTVQMQTSETNPAALQQLDAATHGQLATPADTVALSAIYTSVARALGNRYVLSYQSEATGPTTLVVSVRSGDLYQVSEPVALALPGTAATPARCHVHRPWVLDLEGRHFARTAGLLRRPGRRGPLDPGPAHPANSVNRRTAGGVESSSLSLAAEHLVARIDQLLRRRGRIAARTEALQQAGLKLRPADYVALVGAAAVTAAAAGLLLGGYLLAVLFAVLTRWWRS